MPRFRAWVTTPRAGVDFNANRLTVPSAHADSLLAVRITEVNRD